MTTATNGASVALRLLTIAAAAAGTIALTSALALAGSCPADKVGANSMTGMPDMPKGVSDAVLAQVDLSRELVKIEDHMFRMRRLEIKPGGVVPFHDHADRPAIIYIIKGTIIEHSTNCTVPIVHKAGEVAMESVGLKHWWVNTSKSTVVLISADILHARQEEQHTM